MLLKFLQRRSINIAANNIRQATSPLKPAVKRISLPLRKSLPDQRLPPVTVYEALPITDRKADLALTFTAASALIYGLSMANLFASFSDLPSDVKSGKNGEAVRKLHIERGKKWMIIGTTLFGSISVAIGAFFVKSRYILQLKALALDTTKPIIEVTTTGLWHAKNAVFQVPASQFRPLGRGGIEQMKGKKYIKFRDYRHPLAYYYMTPTKSHVRDLKLIEQLFYSR